MKRYVFLFLLGHFCAINLLAQVIYPEPLKLPSLEAQSLGEFSEIPADLHTGRVNIEIPIYVVKYGDVELPISIAYQGGGVRVTDECGAVGLGWTLNAGGVVNHIVRGMPDDLQDSDWKIYGYNHLNSSARLPNNLNGEGFLDFLNSVKDNNLEVDPAVMLQDPDNINLISSFALYGAAYDEGHFDASPDNYQFSVNNLSGAFAIINGQIVCQTGNRCQVYNDNSNGYRLRDENGTKYYLRAEERQIYPYRYWFSWDDLSEEQQPLQKHKYVSSWWLTSICSEGGDSLSLAYDMVCALHDSPTTYGYSQRYSFTSENEEITIKSEFSNPYERTDTTYHKVLRTIETPLCEVIFSYKNTSQLQFPQLDSISIYSRSNMRTPVETYSFHYSHSSNRALLTQVVHTGENGERQIYDFLYDSIWEVEPHQDQRDHWGFYSPKSTGRFPLRCGSYGHPIAISGSRFSERFATDSTSTNCVLTSVIYPSGLEAKLTWEPHDFDSLSYIGKKAMHDENYNNTLSETLVQKSSSRLCGKNSSLKLSESYVISETTSLEIDMTHYYETAKDANSGYHSCVMEWNTEGDLYNRAYVEVLNGNSQVNRFYISDYISQRPQLTLAPGTYTVRLMNPTNMLRTDGGVCGDYWTNFNYSGVDEWPDGYIDLRFYKRIVTPSSSQARSVGGVRIKQIKYLSGNQTLLTKQYEYKKEDGATSSGILAYPPRYYSFYDVYETKLLTPSSRASALITSGSKCLNLRSNGLPYALNGGSHIEYSRVMEQLVSGSNKLNRIIHHYTCGNIGENSDIIDFDTHQISAIPSSMIQLTSRNYMRGIEYKTEIFTDEAVVQENNYEIFEDDSSPTINGSLYPFADYSRTGYLYAEGVKPYKNYGLTYYRIIPYNKRLRSTTSNGSRSGESVDLYLYANSQYDSSLQSDLPIKHLTVTSEGDTLTEMYSYLPNTGKIMSCITTRHSPGNNQKRVINAYRIVYDSANRAIEKWVADLTQQSPITSWTDAEELTTDLTESCMYVNNRIVQKTDHHKDLSTVILWSYANSYPVAEIENATWTQVESIMGANALQQLSNSVNPDLSVLDVLRTSLPACRVRTYQYRPLVGVTCSTDENGQATYYSYDDFGKLSEVYYMKDGQKVILGHQDYHWSNQ